jgi:hypothetical protein
MKATVLIRLLLKPLVLQVMQNVGSPLALSRTIAFIDKMHKCANRRIHFLRLIFI